MKIIQMPKKVEYIIKKLQDNGYEAYIVGGCVRDSILGRVPGDWDITTSAKPWQVKKVFDRTVDTGIEHGTVTVLLDKEGFEVTTYRIDGEYEDSRHPKSVEFTGSLREDLARRDFTINAMAYNPSTGIVDLYEGLEDLKKKRVRCVGCAGQRFDEDALRILRAVRFAAQLKFDIEPKTAQAIREKAHLLKNISAERIQAELVKLLISPCPQKLHTAFELGITSVILPEYDRIVGVGQNTPNHIYTVDVHTIKAMQNIEPKAYLRLTMLFHDFGKPEVKKCVDGRDIFYRHPEVSARIAKDILKRLKFDNDTTNRVVRLVKWHGLKYDASPVHVRRALNRVGSDIFEDFIRVQRADILAKSPSVIARKLELLKEKERIYHQAIDAGECYCVKMLAIGGQELIKAGIAPGPLLGAILERLTDLVIERPELNTPPQLVDLALEIKDREDIFEKRKEFKI